MPPIPRRHLLAFPALAAAAAAPATGGRAQQPAGGLPWPERPVRFVIPFPGGSTPDIAGRAVAQHFGQVFGQSFVPDNRTGAGGTIGTEAIARAADGHTIGVSIGGPASTAKVLNPELPYDPARDLAPVSLLARLPYVVAVHPSVPARDLRGLIAHAKAHPGRISFGSVGPGSISHLAAEELRARHGLDMVHVPYRGVGPAVLDLVAGRIELFFAASAGVLGQVREGQVRALAVTSDARLPQLPEVPTVAEAGEPEAAAYGWIGLFAPAAHTPPARLARLAEEARRALLGDPRTRAALEAAGFEVVAAGPAEFAPFLEAEVTRWGGLIRRLGLRPEG